MDSWDQMNCDTAYGFCNTEMVDPYYNISANSALMNEFERIIILNSQRGVSSMSASPARDILVTQRIGKFIRVTLSFYFIDTDFFIPAPSWIEDYLNSDTVRKTIGVDPEFGNFSIISQEVNVAFSLTGDHLHENQLQVAELLHRGVRVLIYAGENDFICNWIGNELWSKEMDWAGHADFASQPLVDWFIDGNAVGKTRTSGNLTFATIHSAGHLVRQPIISSFKMR